MEASIKNYFKFFLGLILCLLVRLIPFRAPNVEPILATMMPFSKVYGAFVGFSFAVLSILLYDIVTGTLGIQTFFTAIAYGILGLWAARYFSAQKCVPGGKKDKWGYVRFAIFGTLFFDAFTGLSVGPIFFHQSFFGSLVGQIPFTALHLLSNVVFAFALSPTIYNFLIRKKKEKKLSFISIFHPKTT
ncbi:hypothetical protein KKG24_02985 [Patescibacteria group bacterium]|nr:hypothetical protein [Patescibacteria group bacterium]